MKTCWRERGGRGGEREKFKREGERRGREVTEETQCKIKK